MFDPNVVRQEWLAARAGRVLVGHGQTFATIEESFLAKILVGDECWLWIGPINNWGYGRLKFAGDSFFAHIIAWQLFVGPIPDGMELDHLCRRRFCVSPAHLEPVPHRVNVLRGEHPAAVTARTGICKRGHAIDGSNILQQKNGKTCRFCHNKRLAQQERA